jgi:hypothetical protein
MPSVSLCVRVVFKGKRPTYDWLADKSALFGVPGEWVAARGGALVDDLPDGTWVARWLCAGGLPHDPDVLASARRHLENVATSIEEAWERENEPAVPKAQTEPADSIEPVEVLWTGEDEAGAKIRIIRKGSPYVVVQLQSFYAPAGWQNTAPCPELDKQLATEFVLSLARESKREA